MTDCNGRLLNSVMADDRCLIREALASGAEINARCDDGASVLYSACQIGNAQTVQLLLEAGADPNLRAEDPANMLYAAKPLDYVMQLQFLLDWDKYKPIFDLLVGQGASQSDGHVPTPEAETARKARAIAWQQKGKRR